MALKVIASAAARFPPAQASTLAAELLKVVSSCGHVGAQLVIWNGQEPLLSEAKHHSSQAHAIGMACCPALALESDTCLQHTVPSVLACCSLSAWKQSCLARMQLWLGLKAQSSQQGSAGVQPGCPLSWLFCVPSQPNWVCSLEHVDAACCTEQLSTALQLDPSRALQTGVETC